jgi:hypothetical protein
MTRRSSTCGRLTRASAALAAASVEEAFGRTTRQQLGWLGFAALPLLLPVAVPGMATTVGALCVMLALGVALGRPLRLPDWLARRRWPPRAAELIARSFGRLLERLATVSRPRWIALSHQGLRVVHGAVLAVAGLALLTPVPLVSFDNVLPAAAVVLIAWGLRIRDGMLLAAGYVATLFAVASVILLWWGGVAAVRWFFAI